MSGVSPAVLSFERRRKSKRRSPNFLSQHVIVFRSLASRDAISAAVCARFLLLRYANRFPWRQKQLDLPDWANARQTFPDSEVSSFPISLHRPTLKCLARRS
ncbi:hypothetical protein L596_002913 [Steinernema carpocapsae]|uniref:Uncharacterized protein n=1 Tax=Steinernema carpocapsae TaxID=34508 RepID=A0A4U8USH2_STECR|nr:hypothetical protein L596_002913 [Steinernema carpocapsae]